ncbi:hypothetical protein WOSG25_061330 [Weissella oryzae SG25]|uniref:Uncharacterized protein n=1 Tax=Weissella oryzae (strain DSM 25784 / JCM 18191 / LMG 30913 / SG25) TaxID=1329250 RepID=A0A069CUU2_WEIOS|nr:hypothetical protein WOSG25_061330 [Weissella oryzae SG25]
MTISEYSIRMLAFSLSRVDLSAQLAQQAWLTQQVSAVDKDGMSPFKTFKDFFDYEAEVEKVYKPEIPEVEMNQELVERAKRLQEYRKIKKGG